MAHYLNSKELRRKAQGDVSAGLQTDISRVVLAVKFMGSSKYSANDNGYCTTGLTRPQELWGDFIRIRHRNAIFENDAALRKVKREEEPTQQDTFNVKSKLRSVGSDVNRP